MGFELTDQIGNRILFAKVPERIVSLVPSLTELLFDIGIGEKVVGVTKFCIHPENKIKFIPEVGGTKDFDVNKIMSLKPDLVVASKEENLKERIELLSETIPVYVSDIKDLSDTYQLIDHLGLLFGMEAEAVNLTIKIQDVMNQIPPVKNKPSVVYFIWRKPYMAVGGDTFIHYMLSNLGLKNVYEQMLRYPSLELSNLQKINPDFIFLSTEPYPFKQRHVEEMQGYFPKAKVILVNGEYFSWYGSRLLYSKDYFSELVEEINNFFSPDLLST